MSKITYPKTVASALRSAETVLLLAPKSALAKGWHHKLIAKEHRKLFDEAVVEAEPGDLGTLVATYTGAKRPKRIIVGTLPDRVSRHNSPSRSEYIFQCVSAAGVADRPNVAVLVHASDASQVLACANAVGRALPNYSRKSGKKKTGSLAFLAIDPAGKPLPASANAAEVVAAALWAGRLVDTPTADLTTADFVREARGLLKGVRGVRTSVIVGNALLAAKLGGLHAVGRAAAVAPRMLVLDYRPAKKSRKQRTIALVGKGVVYDTGGLNLKGASMSGMKGDMGGAAAVVGAFRVLAAARFPHRVLCAVPLAENAIDKDSYRPDDIITMHSGKTVEINNTDAEGRLLLGDGVSFLGRKYSPDVIIDAATLTGAQLVATGYRHASIVCNRDGLESRAVAAGMSSGDLAHPLLFAPEFYQSEFKSLIADMKNSVKDRANAQVSCAAQFVYSHIQDLDIPWLHIDLAGPSTRNGRGSGFGVALISSLVAALEDSDLQ